jgi:acyl-homoserine lactone synthase
MAHILVVDWSNKALYQEQLKRYFQLRHEIYVVERKWRALARPIAIEMDAFDNEHAVYLIAIDGRGDVVGGTRLVPTTKPHLLCDVFPELANGSPPRASDIYEWTRFFIALPYRSSGKPAHLAGEMLCGLLEASQQLGIRKISVVCEAFWPDRLRAIGWTVELLGDPLNQDDCEIVGVLLEVTEAALAGTRHFYGLEGSVLHRSGVPPRYDTSPGLGP